MIIIIERIGTYTFHTSLAPQNLGRHDNVFRRLQQLAFLAQLVKYRL